MDQFMKNMGYRVDEYNQDLLRFKLRNGINDIDQNELNHRVYMSRNGSIMNSGPSGHPMLINNMQNGMGTTNLDEQNRNYYQEYCRLFIANAVLNSQVKELVAEKNELIAKLTKCEQKKQNEDFKKASDENNNEKDKNKDNTDDKGEFFDDKKKRYRRLAAAIDRNFQCPYQNCQKSYGCEGSLNQHVRLKHSNRNPNLKELKVKLTKKDMKQQIKSNQFHREKVEENGEK